MKRWCSALLILLFALSGSAGVAHGQRLSEGFRTSDWASLITQTRHAGQNIAYQLPQVSCGGSTALKVVEGALVGAAGGWFTYEFVVGIWRAGEGAKQDTGLRTTLMLGGAGIGVLWVGYSRLRC